MRCKEIASDLLFDATLWDDDVVLVRQTTSGPASLYIISMALFAKKFGAIGD